MKFKLRSLGEASLVNALIKTQEIFLMFFIRWTLLENVICVAVLHTSALVRTDSVKLSKPSVILVLLPETK